MLDNIEVFDSEGMNNSVEEINNNIEEVNNTIYENSENGKTDKWVKYDGHAKSSIKNIYNNDLKSRVIKITTNGLTNAYKIGSEYGKKSWKNNGNVIKWDFNFKNKYTIYVNVKTKKGERYLYYTNDDKNLPIQKWGKVSYLHHGLGKYVEKNTWTTITRNLQKDLNNYEPNNKIISINSFSVRGDMMLDNIEVFSSEGLSNKIRKIVIHKKKQKKQKKQKTNYTNLKIGAQPVPSTPLSKGTIIVSNHGNGNSCTKSKPCSIQTAFRKAKAGDVVFLRGGIYRINKTLIPTNSGTSSKPIIFESYPGENAIIQSTTAISSQPGKNIMIIGLKTNSNNNYIKFRKMEIRYFGDSGVGFWGSHNTVEGCDIHHNGLAGIAAYGGEWHENRKNYVIPYRRGYNLIANNRVHHNSDIGTPANGGNADGINIQSGTHNRVINNTVYSNSDDGIDSWRSNDSYFGYNIVFDQGKANGDGNGIKGGGNLNPNSKNGWRTVIEHNISFNNKKRGIDCNSGKSDIFKHNTTYNNGLIGYISCSDTVVEDNISYHDARNSGTNSHSKNNSWQSGKTPIFISTNPNSKDFLKQTDDSPLKGIGAYGK